jgi:hypothetical protein
MIHLKKFNEGFDVEDYKDYLLSSVEESNIRFEYSDDNILYVEYKMSLQKVRELKKYLGSIRFNNVVVNTFLYEDYDVYCVSIVNKEFFDRNEQYYYENLEWIYVREWGTNNDIASDLPDGYTLVKNDDNYNLTFYVPDSVNTEPDNEDDRGEILLTTENMIYTQFILFKYLGK